MPQAGPKLLTQIAAVHFVSHVHIMLIPALLPVLPGLLGVGFVELGVALAVFNIVSALVQAPLGFAVDHYGARKVLKAGLLLGSLSFLMLAVSPGYAVLLVAMALAGLANGVYHPADYALLVNGIEAGRLGRSFSIHTFAGFLGSAVTPAVFLGIAAVFGTQAALAAGAVVGIAALLLISVPRSGIYQVCGHGNKSDAGLGAAPGRVRLLTPMIGVLTVLFILLNLSTSAIEKFSVAALVQGQGLTLAWANTALTAFLLSSAVGVLCGGALADRTRRHGLVAAMAFALAAALTTLVALGLVRDWALVAVLGAIGLLTGVIAPSRDMLVKAAAPRGAEGKTFGLVSTGFNIGGALGPIAFGWMLDQRLPEGIFIASVVFMLLTVLLTLAQEAYLASKRRQLA
ncbi:MULTISPECIES: MFS transporter [Pseudomonas]|uniref:Major facilitator transporter n=1 Tax=Pseudomonas putida TaxID=303 RepID=A0A1L7N9Z6_PSEPU|nr:MULTISPECIES: MFS transporter [Pseudomonas]MBP2084469.1 MFS family permease [Pseudomonas sp. PvP089]MBP2089830.1 MFS family permease [Pseudomonas sp. PvP088]MBP2224007.1 MFS family permease [Pseudomonas putida]MDO1496185.1 MFS transporter [Pseudomonas putida]PMY80173.1 MFS transporter [Pseudomonas sp. FW306-2-2C-D06B]